MRGVALVDQQHVVRVGIELDEAPDRVAGEAPVAVPVSEGRGVDANAHGRASHYLA